MFSGRFSDAALKTRVVSALKGESNAFEHPSHSSRLSFDFEFKLQLIRLTPCFLPTERYFGRIMKMYNVQINAYN